MPCCRPAWFVLWSAVGNVRERGWLGPGLVLSIEGQRGPGRRYDIAQRTTIELRGLPSRPQKQADALRRRSAGDLLAVSRLELVSIRCIARLAYLGGHVLLPRRTPLLPASGLVGRVASGSRQPGVAGAGRPCSPLAVPEIAADLPRRLCRRLVLSTAGACHRGPASRAWQTTCCKSSMLRCS